MYSGKKSREKARQYTKKFFNHSDSKHRVRTKDVAIGNGYSVLVYQGEFNRRNINRTLEEKHQREISINTLDLLYFLVF